jgi:hypothetical protein
MMMRTTLTLLAVLLMTACGGDAGKRTTTPTAPTPPVAPAPPPPPACQSNSTAVVRFGNTSRATTQTIFWDGLNVATLAPGQTSGDMTTAAGVAHRLETRITNSTTLACSVSTPIPSVCGNHTYTCAFP